jgi:hypothetical protein
LTSKLPESQDGDSDFRDAFQERTIFVNLSRVVGSLRHSQHMEICDYHGKGYIYTQW